MQGRALGAPEGLLVATEHTETKLACISPSVFSVYSVV